jgi:hypothetical protein
MPRASAMRALRSQQRQQVQATGYVVSAPVGGLNARDALSNMPETDAIVLDNWFVQPTWVELRRGKTTLATFTGICETVAAYNSLSGSNQLYGGVINSGVGSIYRMDTAGGGAVGAAVVGGGSNTIQAVTNVQYDWTQFGTGSAEVLVLVNGVDNPLIYDGTTWWPITAPISATVTAITQAASAVVTVSTVSGTNPFAIGETVGLTGVGGMTQINNVNAKVTNIGGASGAWTVTINVNSTGFGAYTSGGTLSSPFPYAFTGGPVPLTSLSQVIRYKSRLWFIQAGTMNIYYLPQNVFAGALTLLPMGPNFNLGGNLAMMATNSVDNAAGINDYMAFISNQGEVVLYQGYDPAQVATWFEAGHFRIGRPLALGRRGNAKIGSDAAVLCADGLTPLSKALVADRSQPLIAITDKIRSDINTDAQAFGLNTGWQVLLYPMGTKLIINMPTLTNSTSYQYVQNTISGAWCTFGKYNSAWNALCFETMGDNLYYGTVGSVAQCDTGNSDDGMPYLVTAKPAFSYMDDREHLKIFAQCQPIFQVTGNVSFAINMLVDFDQTAATGTVPVSAGNSAVWNVAMWNISLWGDNAKVVKPWIGLAATGYSGSLELRATVMGLTAKWQSTNYLYKPGGLFYGMGA